MEQFHASQDRYRIHATYQGDYFEALAKLRTALAARAAPALTHVIGEVMPYLAEAGVLEPLDRFGETRDSSISCPRSPRRAASPTADKSRSTAFRSTGRRPLPT